MSGPRYYTEDGEPHDCEIIERNGNLILVEDLETGEQDWLCPFEVEED